MGGYEDSPDYGGPPKKPFDWLGPLFLFIVILAGILWLDDTARAQDNTIVGKASVVDGDTIEIHGTRIRLWGIDAPESNQTCTTKDGKRQRVGQQASFVLANLAEGKTVSCLQHTKDRYGRPVASCSIEGADLSRHMVVNGWAWAFTRYSSDYVSAEQEARAQDLNIWSLTCTVPWDWRKQQRSSEATPAPQGGRYAQRLGYVSAAALNVRECPSASCSVVDRLTQGTALTLEEEDSKWVRVSNLSGEALGWAASRFIASSFDQASRTQSAAAQTASAALRLSDAQVRRRLIQESMASYYGSCPCPYNVDRGGRSCGRRSAYSRPGGASPLCYPADVSAEEVAAFRARGN